MKFPERFPQHVNFIIRSVLLALGLFESAENLVDLLQHLLQFGLDLLHLLNGLADGSRRPLRGFSCRLLTRAGTPAPPAAASAEASPSSARTSRLASLLRGSGCWFRPWPGAVGLFVWTHHLSFHTNFRSPARKCNGINAPHFCALPKIIGKMVRQSPRHLLEGGIP